jgi:Ca2+-binding RTX toxin-like protein
VLFRSVASIGFSEAIDLDNPTAPPLPLVDPQGDALPLPDGNWVINTQIMDLKLMGKDAEGNNVMLRHVDGLASTGQIFATGNTGDEFIIGDSFMDVFFEIVITDPSGSVMTIAPDPNLGPVTVSMNFTDNNQPPVPQQIARNDLRWMPTFFWAEGDGRELVDANGNVWDVLVDIHAVPHAETDKPVRPVVVPTLEFGNRRPTSIHGLKFDDLNGNGARDPGEPGIAGWMIMLDGQNPANDRVTITMADDPTTPAIDETGMYWFNNVIPDDVVVSEENRVGWTQTAPGGPGTYSVTVAGGDRVEDLDFRNFKNITIHGVKFLDSDFDGQRDAGEIGLPNITIFLDTNNNGQPDDGPGTTAVTAADGSYSFPDLGPGLYRIREVQQAGFVQTTPIPDVNVAAQSGLDVIVDFGNAPDVAISGTKFNDRNSNGQRDPGDSPLAGFTVELYLDVDNDGTFERNGPFGAQHDDGSPVFTSVTNSAGFYRLGDLTLPTGRYFVRELGRQGWHQTFPANPDFYTVNHVTGNTVTGLDFGNHSCGDLFDVGNGARTVTAIRNGVLTIELIGGGSFVAVRADGQNFDSYGGNADITNGPSANSRASEFDGTNQRIDILIDGETPPGTQFNLVIADPNGDLILRVLNAVDINAAGTLQIVGDDCGDFIAVRDDPADGANSDAKRIFVGAIAGVINGGADLTFTGVEYNKDIINGIFGSPTISRVQIDGAGGDDIIRVGDDITVQQTVLTGGNGDDVIRAGDKIASCTAASVRTSLWAGANDILNGGNGNDLIFGAAGGDRAFGGNGDDIIGGGDDNDALLRGGNGNDRISGGRGRDRLLGDGGFDIAYAGVDGLADLLVSAEQRNVSPDTVEPLLETLIDEFFRDGVLDGNDTIDELIDNILLP